MVVCVSKILIVTSGQLHPQEGQLLGDILGARLGDRAVEGDNMRDVLTEVCGADDTDTGKRDPESGTDGKREPETATDGTRDPEIATDGKRDPEIGTEDNDPENIRDCIIEGETEIPGDEELGDCTGEGDFDKLLTFSTKVILIPTHHIEFVRLNVELVSTKTHSSPALFVVKLNVLLIPCLIEDTFRISKV